MDYHDADTSSFKVKREEEDEHLVSLMGEQFEAPLFADKPLQFTASSRRSPNAELRLRGQAYYGIVQDCDMRVKYSQNKPMPARKQVCQNMFLNTFDLNSAKVRGWKMKIG